MLLQRVQQFLDHDNNNLQVTLHHFASKGDVEATESLLQSNPELDIDISNPRSFNTSLHAALIQNQQGAIIDVLTSKGANVNAFNRKGFNPLILSIRHCRPGIEALKKLVQSGATMNTLQKGRFVGLSLLDFAEMWKHKKAIQFLTEIGGFGKETGQIQINHKNINLNIDEGKSICPLCNHGVKFPTRMSFLKFNQDQAEREHERLTEKGQLCVPCVPIEASTTSKKVKKNSKELYITRKYFDEFISYANGDCYRKLCRIEYHGVSNMHKLRKEVSESFAILHAVKNTWIQLQHGSITNDTSNHVSFKDVFLIDLCSGKSLTSSLCSVMFPIDGESDTDTTCNNYVLAVDKLPMQLVGHCHENTKYLSRDIMTVTFFKELAEEVHHQSSVEGRTVILVGMHLCGNLSGKFTVFLQ